jgi:2-iminoacetate synthase ThiH
MHAADAASPVSLTRDRLVGLIGEAGCTPVERDALYHTVHVHDDYIPCESPVSQ